MKIALILGLSLALLPAAAAQSLNPVGGKVVETTLTEIRNSPNAYRGVWVRITVQFASLGKVSNPFFTQFEPSKYANFYVWADEQAIWRKDQYEDIFGLMFVDKSSRVAKELYKAKLYERVEVIAIVRNVFQAKPWIEIVQFDPLERRVNTATLSHVYRGETHMQNREWRRAIAELSLAPGEELPDLVRGQIHKNLAHCYLRLGEASEAVDHIERADKLVKGKDREITRLLRVASVKPETFLDRTLRSNQIEDYQRPMWEAFDSESGATTTSGTPGITQPTPSPRK